MKPQALGLLGIASASILFMGAAWADGGKVLGAKDATLVRGGTEQPLQIGGTVQAGDELRTGKSGTAKWVMDDDSLRAIGRNSTVAVNEFAMPANNGGKGRTVMTLFKGALRTISGLIGQSPNDEYTLRTPVATMGIRGTTYGAAWCQDNCFNASPNGPRVLPNGLYVSVEDGAVELRNAAGTLTVSVGQTGYVSSSNEPPRLVEFKLRIFEELADFMEVGFDLSIDGSIGVPPDPEVPASPSQQPAP